ncbi:c-type cytochrome [Staphylospora marina]|uniref:c-type cytochrome n=1 Tax=Staphylospora marina TaxID=2490858 RepID=UPI000F5BEB3A|nr:c-type cytochrome [Staphylospora marina]
MKPVKLALMLMTTLSLAACSPGPEKKTSDSETAQTAAPEQVYLQHCANCHGGSLEGAYAPPLKEVGNKYDRDEILNIIRKGKGKMPSQDYVPKEDQEKLADWLVETTRKQ